MRILFTFSVKPFCKPDQTNVYGVAKREKIHVSCEVVANPSDNLYFYWVFNSSSEKLDLQENLISSRGSKSIAEHTPQVKKMLNHAMFVFFKSGLLLSQQLTQKDVSKSRMELNGLFIV